MVTVIVPLDGSTAAERALAPAEWLADTLDGSIVLVTVSMAVDHHRDHEVLHRATAQLRPGTWVRHVILTGSYPGQSIIRAALTYDDPIVCLSTRGDGALATAVIGRVAMEVLAHSSLPVVLVGPSYDPTAPGDGGILQCIDTGDPLTSDRLGPTCAARGDLDLHVLHVRRDHPDEAAQTEAPEVGATPALARSPRAKVHVLTGHLAADDVPRAILSVIRTVRPRLVGIRRHACTGGIERPLGRTGTELVRVSPCPVLVDPPLVDLTMGDARTTSLSPA